MIKWFSRIAIALGLIFGLGVLVLFGAARYLESDHAQRRIKGRVNERIAGRFSWGQARLSLMRGRLEIRRPVLQDPSEKTLLAADHLFLDLSIRKLLSGVLYIESAGIAGPRVDLRINRDGTLNLSDALTIKGASKRSPPADQREGAFFPFNVVIGNFMISDGAFRFASVVAEKTETAVMESIDISLREVDLAQKSGHIDVDLGMGVIDMAGIKTRWDKFLVDARVSKGAIAPGRLKIQSDFLTVDMQGDGRELTEDPEIDLRLKIGARLEDIRRTFHLSQDISGLTQIEMTAQGRASDPRVDLALAFGGGRLFGAEFEAFDLEGKLSDRVLSLTAKNIKAASGEASVSAAIDLRNVFPLGFLSAEREMEKISYRVNADLHTLDLKLLPWREIGLAGKARAKAVIDGKGDSLKSLNASARMEMSVQGMTGKTIKEPMDPTLSAMAVVTADRLDVKSFELLEGDTTLTGSGTFEWESYAIVSRIEAESPNLRRMASIFGLPSLGGSLGARVMATGSIRRPVLDIQLKGDAIDYADFRIGKVSTDLHLENGRLNTEALQIENDGAVLILSGSLDVLDPETIRPVDDPALNIAFEGRDLRLEDFYHRIGGKFGVNGRMSGSIKRPEGSAVFSGGGLDIFGQKLERVHLKTRMEGNRFYLEPIRITLIEEEILEGNGWLSFTRGTFSGRVISEKLSLERIQWLEKANFNFGRAKLDLSGHGRFVNPTASGTITVAGMVIQGKETAPIEITASIADRWLQVAAKQDFDLQGKFHITDLEFEARASFNEVDLTPYFEMADQGKWGGMLSGTIACSGNFGRPEKIRADADLSTLTISYDQKTLLESRRFKAEMRESKITATDIRLGFLQQGNVDVRGSAQLNGLLDLTLEAAIPLKGLSLFIPHLRDIDGETALTASLRGLAAKPEITGTLRLNRIRLTPTDFMDEIQDVNAIIHFTPKALQVETIAGKVGAGRFGVKGGIAVDGFNPTDFDLHLEASRISFFIPDILDLTVDGRLALKGNPDRSTLTGEIVLVEGLYYKYVKLSLLPDGLSQKREPEPVSPDALPSLLQNIKFDVSIKQKSPFIVDNNIALLNIVSDLKLKGTTVRPQLLGSAQVKEGTIMFIGKEFDIKRGRVDFINPYRIEPTIDIESQVEVRNWIILLKIAGTPDNLVFTKTSTPPESEEDILMLLSAGRTRRELIRDEGGAWVGSKALATEIAAGMVGEQVKAATGLDVFETRYLEKDGEFDSEGVEVTVGKELSRQLTVKYSVGARGGETTQRASSEYRLIENVIASAFQENTGNYGVQMVYRLEFR